MEFETVQDFFCEFSGDNKAEIKLLPQSGSARKNYIVSSKNDTYIITYNSNLRENRAFFYFTELFGGLQLNTPEIFRINESQNLYIQQNVGEKTLSEIIAEEGVSNRVKNLVRQSLKKLFELQQATQGKADYSLTFEYEKYDRLPVTHDLYYFKNYFADVLEVEYHRGALLKEFAQIAETVENLRPQGLMLRDFQPRNILVNKKDEVFFIDYQAAMQGPLLYDVVSLIYQAKANFPEEIRQEFLEYYITLYESEELMNQLREALPYLQLIRFLQVLGAYGFRGLIQQKAHFIQSIENGLKNLFHFSKQWSGLKNYEQLSFVIQQLQTAEIQQKIKVLTHGT